MRRILQRHGIEHANTAEHVDSLPEGRALHFAIRTLSRCMCTWFAPGESYYIPMSSTNWGLQNVEPRVDAEHLTIKRMAFMNAGRYLQDASTAVAVSPGQKRLGAYRRSLVNNLAYHSRVYAAALHAFVLKYPAFASCGSDGNGNGNTSPAGNIAGDASLSPPPPPPSTSMLLFRWTRVNTDVSTTTRPCEYSTCSVLDECALTWCTAVAAHLTLGQFAEAATLSHLMTEMAMQTSFSTCAKRHHVNAFSPPLLDVPCALVVTIRDTLACIRNIATEKNQQALALEHAPAVCRLVGCFERGRELSCLPPHVRMLTSHCSRVLRDCQAFLCIRGLLCKVRVQQKEESSLCNHHQAFKSTSSIIADYEKVKGVGIEGCSDYVIAEMAKLDIAFSKLSAHHE